MPNPHPSPKSLSILSRLLFLPDQSEALARVTAELTAEITALSREEFDDLVNMANLNHVIIRGFEIVLKLLRDARDEVRAGWAEEALAEEHARIKNAIPILHNICGAFAEAGFDVTVIKSLDHWPDLGSDLDLYTNTDSNRTIELMRKKFQAGVAARSWGDRLAGKWNFEIPGLPEAVEIHMQRLGQTGEQITIASKLVGRARAVQVDGLSFRVPAVSDRLMISTLQRMYRHFYFRLCDVVDSAGLAESGAIDYEDLRSAARAAGIWEGVATYMVIVSDYVKKFRGTGLALPQFVTAAARFGGEQVFFLRAFLRVPIMPQSAKLYGSQLTGMIGKGELTSSARLSLLPWLATAAAVGQKITGSDKGIW